MSDSSRAERRSVGGGGGGVPPAKRGESAAKPPVREPVEVRPSPRRTPTEGFGSYGAAVQWLYDRVDIEKARASRVTADMLKLDRMEAILERMGNPHNAVRTVHVAGTKGKGSTCEMLACALEGCGYTVGIYTSPHLVDLRERIRVNRAMIGQGELVAALGAVARAADEVEPGLGPATFFEVITAAAFAHFAEQAVDAAVIEVGLGGRLDSTNVITPEVCGLTSISFDHMEILGDTLEKIAWEKAGIMKPGVPAISVPQKPGVVAVFRDAADAVGTPLRVIGEDLDFSVRFDVAPGGRGVNGSGVRGPQARVGLTTARFEFEHVPVPLMGEHQAFNCVLALGMLDALAERGFQIDQGGILEGLAKAEMPGRMELVAAGPAGGARVLLDGAHNADSMKQLMKGISTHIPYDSMVVIFGCNVDKDIPGMLKELASGADKVIFTKAGTTPRAADPKDLARKFTETSGKMSHVTKNLAEAMSIAARAAGRDDLVCITGSLYLVGEAKKLMGR
jgi:dihydrofolate synthase/folylpolyglutamate synthase